MEVYFLFDNALVNGIETLIRDADKSLLLVSPYINLDRRIQVALAEKLENPDFELRVLFGKNKWYPYKSVKKDSFDFLMEFPNIEIRYSEMLHAKFYQNDSHFIMTSMNLYDYSLANNIEVGVIGRYGSKSIAGKLADRTSNLVNKGVESLTSGVLGIDNAEVDPIVKFRNIFENADLKYKTKPKLAKQKGLSGLLGSKRVKGFKVVEDTLSQKSNDAKKEIAVKKSEDVKSKNSETKSATQLGKQKGISGAQITKSMEEKGFVKDGKITDTGSTKGLEMKKFRDKEYIAYPVAIEIE